MQDTVLPASHAPSRRPRSSTSAEEGEAQLSESVYGRLKHALIIGELEPGAEIKLRTLAAQVGTSPMPVRDALRRLIAERALAFRPNRTVTVPIMTRGRFQEILQVRLSLEVMAARRAMPMITSADIARFEAITEAMVEAGRKGEVGRYVELNRDFHFAIYERAESWVLLPFIESLWMQVGPFLRRFFVREGIRPDVDNHARVVRALRRGDAVSLGDEIVRDIADAADVLLRHGDLIER
jgi:DNA-binding GntR family transcriptional regulator